MYICLSSATKTCVVPNRCVGGLTGSRVAGACGRIPVEQTIADRHSIWNKWAFAGRITMSVYIDNLYSAASSAHGATTIIQDAEDYLRDNWNLKIKPSSKVVMPVIGHDPGTLSPSWNISPVFIALGHHLTATGSIQLCVDTTIKQLWACFWKNIGGRDLAKIPIKYKLVLMQRSLEPLLRYKMARWPFQETVAKRLDKLQRRMIGIALHVAKREDETPEQYVRRRGRTAAAHQTSFTSWSVLWARLIVSWHDHILRPRNQGSWATRLTDVKSPEELAWRRACFASRPATRTQSGWCCRRWWEGVQYAKLHLNSCKSSV